MILSVGNLLRAYWTECAVTAVWTHLPHELIAFNHIDPHFDNDHLNTLAYG